MFSNQVPENAATQNGSRWVSVLRRIVSLKTRTKLLLIFAMMFGGLFYAHLVISHQIKASNISIENQSTIIKDQMALSSIIGCFGTVKYWVSIIEKGLREDNKLPTKGAESLKCSSHDTGDSNIIESLGQDVQRLRGFADDAKFTDDARHQFLKNVKQVEKDYTILRNQTQQASSAIFMGDAEAGKSALNLVYPAIDGINKGLNDIVKALNQASIDISTQVDEESRKFKQLITLFLAFGTGGLILASFVIFFNVFRPVENIISTMINASQDPHNTKDYMMKEHKGGTETDEVGEVILALNSLLLQVHEGFKSTEAAEQESAAAARQLDAIFNSVADGLITVNTDGEIESLNQSVYGIFGYDRQTIRDRKITDFLPEEFAAKYMQGLQSFISNSGGDVVDSGPKEMRGVKITGDEIPIELSVTSVPLDSDHPIFVNVIRDITYRKDLERQLVQAQKMEALGSMAGGIAHEINTPTQYVRDNLKFMQEVFEAYDGFYKTVMETKDALPQNIQEQLAEAEKKRDLAFFSGEAPQALAQSLEGVHSISEIVGAIRGFSYPATDDISYIDLNQALKNTITVSRNQWKEFLQVKTEFEENLPPVPCIPGKLTQVVLNLIVNATHAIEEKCKGQEDPEHNFITVATSATKKKVTIKVSDSGTGIPKENINKIFNPFFTTKEVGKGTGQGLSISYDIVVNKHGGTLNVESEVGKGTTFIIELPMEVDSSRIASKKGSAA